MAYIFLQDHLLGQCCTTFTTAAGYLAFTMHTGSPPVCIESVGPKLEFLIFGKEGHREVHLMHRTAGEQRLCLQLKCCVLQSAFSANDAEHHRPPSDASGHYGRTPYWQSDPGGWNCSAHLNKHAPSCAFNLTHHLSSLETESFSSENCCLVSWL